MLSYKEIYNERYKEFIKRYNEIFNPKNYKKKKALASVRIRCTSDDIFSWSNSIDFSDYYSGNNNNMVIFYIKHNAELTLTMFMNLERYYETE